MILFVTTADHRYTLKRIARGNSGSGAIRIVSYDWLFRQSRIRAACVVFTDFDRLRHHELSAAGSIFRQLRDGGMPVLNDPARAKQRYDLLNALHAAGINRFRAYPAVTRPQPGRFPVFVKCTADHAQDFDELVADQDGLDRMLERIETDGTALRDLLVIEFANSPVRDNVFLRKTVYRVGDRILAGSPVQEDSPFVKYGRLGLTTDDEYAMLTEWIDTNPDAETLRRAFDIAHIEFGRADFGHDGDGLAIYEINTNPHFGARVRVRNPAFYEATVRSHDAVVSAIRALDGDDISVSLHHGKRLFSRMRLKAGFFLKMP